VVNRGGDEDGLGGRRCCHTSGNQPIVRYSGGHRIMKELTTREVWRAVLGELQLQLPRPTFETWLKQTEGISCDGNSFIVEVPTPFAVAWLERRMYQSIQKTVEKITQQSLDIQFQVKNGSPHASGVTPGNSRVLEPLAPPLLPKDELSPSSNSRNHQPPCLSPKYTFGSFVVGSSNRLAYSAARAICEAPGSGYNPLFIYSGVGLGKTHLLHAIGHVCAARGLSVLYATSEQFTNEFISAIRNRTTEEFRRRYRSVQVLLMDDVQFLTRHQYGCNLFLAPLADAQKQIIVSTPPAYRVILYRRFMVRITEALARRHGAKAMVTGESCGQVSSQTLENIAVIDQAANMPILRPLIGFNKEEIVDLARAIETFPISIQPDQDCCSLFVPRHPETRASLETVLGLEAGLPVDELVQDAVVNTETREFNGRLVHQGIAMKVDEIGSTAALHHLPGGHRRVDTPRKHDHHLPAYAHRQSPMAAHFLKVK